LVDSTHRSFVRGIMQAMEEYEWEMPEGQEAAFVHGFTDDVYAMAATAVSTLLCIDSQTDLVSQLKFTLDLRREGNWDHDLSFRSNNYMMFYGAVRHALAVKRANDPQWGSEFTTYVRQQVSR
jgi:hypothetical protein